MEWSKHKADEKDNEKSPGRMRGGRSNCLGKLQTGLASVSRPSLLSVIQHKNEEEMNKIKTDLSGVNLMKNKDAMLGDGQRSLGNLNHSFSGNNKTTRTKVTKYDYSYHTGFGSDMDFASFAEKQKSEPKLKRKKTVLYFPESSSRARTNSFYESWKETEYINSNIYSDSNVSSKSRSPLTQTCGIESTVNKIEQNLTPVSVVDGTVPLPLISRFEETILLESTSRTAEKSMFPLVDTSNKDENRMIPSAIAPETAQNIYSPEWPSAMVKETIIPSSPPSQKVQNIFPRGWKPTTTEKGIMPPAATSRSVEKWTSVTTKNILPSASTSNVAQNILQPEWTSTKTEKRITPPGATSRIAEEGTFPREWTSATSKRNIMPTLATSKTSQSIFLPAWTSMDEIETIKKVSVQVQPHRQLGNLHASDNFHPKYSYRMNEQQGYACQWKTCQETMTSGKDLLHHIIQNHLQKNDDRGDASAIQPVCHWRGCTNDSKEEKKKVYRTLGGLRSHIKRHCQETEKQNEQPVGRRGFCARLLGSFRFSAKFPEKQKKK